MKHTEENYASGSVTNKYYLETRYSNLSPRNEAASAAVPLNAFKLNTSTARESAAAIAMAGAPRTTISRIADLNIVNIKEIELVISKQEK